MHSSSSFHPVRPARWMYIAASFGGRSCKTIDTSWKAMHEFQELMPCSCSADRSCCASSFASLLTWYRWAFRGLWPEMGKKRVFCLNRNEKKVAKKKAKGQNNGWRKQVFFRQLFPHFLGRAIFRLLNLGLSTSCLWCLPTKQAPWGERPLKLPGLNLQFYVSSIDFASDTMVHEFITSIICRDSFM